VNAASRSAAPAALSALTAALMPKCPLCLIAIASAFGVELPLIGRALLPLLVVFLAAAVSLIIRAALRNGHPAAAVAACACAALVVVQRIAVLPALVGHAAVALLVLAALLASRARREHACDGCRMAAGCAPSRRTPNL
jgi:hypothetical protein